MKYLKALGYCLVVAALLWGFHISQKTLVHLVYKEGYEQGYNDCRKYSQRTGASVTEPIDADIAYRHRDRT